MLNNGFSLDRYQVKDMRVFHNQQLKIGWKGIKEGNIRTRYKEEDIVESGKYIRIESFYTEVCILLKEDGIWWISKEWNGYSATTLRGINLVCEKFGAPKLSKKIWEQLPYQYWTLMYEDGK